MGRKAPEPVDTSRKLKIAKIWKGNIYAPGQENDLPADFPMDGEHWEDYVDDDAEEQEYAQLGGVAALNAQQRLAEELRVEEAQRIAAATGTVSEDDQYAKQNDTVRLPQSSKVTKRGKQKKP